MWRITTQHTNRSSAPHAYDRRQPEKKHIETNETKWLKLIRKTAVVVVVAVQITGTKNALKCLLNTCGMGQAESTTLTPARVVRRRALRIAFIWLYLSLPFSRDISRPATTRNVRHQLNRSPSDWLVRILSAAIFIARAKCIYWFISLSMWNGAFFSLCGRDANTKPIDGQTLLMNIKKL